MDGRFAIAHNSLNISAKCRDVPLARIIRPLDICALYMPPLNGGRSSRASLHFALACPYISINYIHDAPTHNPKNKYGRAICNRP